MGKETSTILSFKWTDFYLPLQIHHEGFSKVTECVANFENQNLNISQVSEQRKHQGCIP